MKTYRTRISVGLVAFIIVVLLVCCLPGILGDGGWRLLISVCVTCVPVFYLLYAIKYTIDGTTLRVTVLGMFNDEYDLTLLESVVPTRTILSAPASSLKRIRLDFTDGQTAVISPRNQEDFLAELRKINPKVKIDETLLLSMAPLWMPSRHGLLMSSGLSTGRSSGYWPKHSAKADV